MCGLFGFVGNTKNNKPDMNKIKILGIYNVIRGRHSCGIVANNTVVKGVGLNSEFTKFIESNQLDELYNDTIQNTVVIGHTRHATKGAHTIKNAHPFVYKNIIGAKNGTVENYKELANQYNIDIEGVEVDSEAMIRILSSVNNKQRMEVLKNYQGGMTIIMQDVNKPNKISIWKGAKLDYNNQYVEERPLFYIEDDNGIYFSSLENSLNAIKSNSEIEVKSFPVNNMINIEKGQITCIPVDRKVKVVVSNYASSYHSDVESTGWNWNKNNNKSSSNSRIGTQTSLSFSEKSIQKDVLEIGDLNEIKGRVYFFKGRYYKNGHRLHGIYELYQDGSIAYKQDKDFILSNTYAFYNGLILKNLNELPVGYEIILSDLFREVKQPTSATVKKQLLRFVNQPFDFEMFDFKERNNTRELPGTNGNFVINPQFKELNLSQYYSGKHKYEPLFARSGAIFFSNGDVIERNFKIVPTRTPKTSDKLLRLIETENIPDINDEFWNDFNFEEVDYEVLSCLTEKAEEKLLDVMEHFENLVNEEDDDEDFEKYTENLSKKQATQILDFIQHFSESNELAKEWMLDDDELDKNTKWILEKIIDEVNEFLADPENNFMEPLSSVISKAYDVINDPESSDAKIDNKDKIFLDIVEQQPLDVLKQYSKGFWEKFPYDKLDWDNLDETKWQFMKIKNNQNIKILCQTNCN